tara:strand:+ start:2222 stop:2473 length:252 start_codon:yes stop_codon:yes gene_type:complete
MKRKEKRQTCLKPVWGKTAQGKKGRIDGYKFNFPEFITEDLGFEMMFGFPTPKDLPNPSDMKEYPRPTGLKTFYISDMGYYTL